MGLPLRSALVGVATATVLAVGAPALAAEPVGVVREAGGATAVPDSYIVVLKDSTVAPNRVGDTAQRLTARHGGKIARTYGTALRGFEVTVSASAAARIAADPAVAYVEQNHTVSISGTQANPPSWGLDRIDQRNLPLDNSYTYPNTASNVHAYIIDTGIKFSHNDFGGRATSGYDAVDGGSADDCNGHGTHVAGTVGGSTYGVAKAVQLVGVRVMNCSGSGTSAGVIAGVDWVTQNAIKPAVANMSLGGGANSSLDTAVRNSIASGVTYGLAAGNDNGANACNTSPARTAEAITVGSTTNTDARSSFSNIGSCLDIFAPGSSITSAWYTSNTATNTISGTSMATPHVVGAAALVASVNPSWTPAQVRNQLVSNATPNVISNVGSGSPNLLLYVGSGGTTPPPTGCSGTNGAALTIPDAGAAVTAMVPISGCGRNASSASTAAVNIVHTYRGDLVIDLLAPDGSSYRLKDSSSSDSADNVNTTYTVNLSGEAADGTWRLQVRDVYSADTGYIASWTLTV
ncbi:S8 family peptidase [Micromonospora sp. DT44]|uniref:S8 family peptidase n=1 Tax=Micromonospora sp. DT44 TaxID=3393439 RepID=UPI003CF33623